MNKTCNRQQNSIIDFKCWYFRPHALSRVLCDISFRHVCPRRHLYDDFIMIFRYAVV